MKKILVLLAATIVASPAAAHMPRHQGHGQLTRAEAIARADQRFAQIDTNRDGRITRAERKQARELRQQARRPNHAARGLTVAEFRQRALKRFERADRNNGGVVTRQERKQMRQQTRRQRSHGRHGR